MQSPDDYENENFEDQRTPDGEQNDYLNVIHIEGQDDIQPLDSSNKMIKSGDSEQEEGGEETDERRDAYAKGFFKNLMKVGPFSKQILNYSYPPLLYQRGEDSNEDDDGEGEESEEEMEEELSHNQFPLDDDFNMDNILG